MGRTMSEWSTVLKHQYWHHKKTQQTRDSEVLPCLPLKCSGGQSEAQKEKYKCKILAYVLKQTKELYIQVVWLQYSLYINKFQPPLPMLSLCMCVCTSIISGAVHMFEEKWIAWWPLLIFILLYVSVTEHDAGMLSNTPVLSLSACSQKYCSS